MNFKFMVQASRLVCRTTLLLTIIALSADVASSEQLEEFVFPEKEWREIDPAGAGFDPDRLQANLERLKNLANNNPYQIVIFRNGYRVAGIHANVDPSAKQPVASIAKSIYASMVPIAVADGKLESADIRVSAVYPRLNEATGIHGPHPGKKRFWLPKDEAVTFRQVVTQTGGMLEAKRETGKSWVYRTDGLVAMIHAIASLYGHYDPDDHDASPGVGDLIEVKLRDPIGASWTWRYRPWRLHPEARYNIFGRFVELSMDTDDMARFGLLYLAEGRWKNEQIIPAEWTLKAGRVADEVRAIAPDEDLKYGYAFWSNEEAQLWPDLPRDSFMAAGFGGHKIWICRSLGLVVILHPDLPAGDFIDSIYDGRSLEAVVESMN